MLKLNRFLSGLLFFVSPIFALPQQPMQGGTGVANSNTNTITTTAPINLPADINLQNAYNQSVALSANSIQLVTGGFEFLDPSAVTQWDIFTEEGLDYIIQTGNTFIANTPGDIVPNSAFFQVASTTQGSIPAPLMTATQENAISSPAQGSQVFNTTHNTLDLYDGSSWQTGLSIQHVLAGANMTVTNPGDGTVILSSTGGGSAPTPAYASYSVIANSAPSPGTAGTFVAVPVSSGFNDNGDACFTTSLESIGGINTPVSRYICATTQYFEVDQSESLQSNATTFRQYIYAIAIVRAGGSIVTTNFQLPATQNSDIANTHSASEHGIVQLAQGDGIFTQIYAGSSDQTAPTIYIDSKISSISGSIPDTDQLPEGTSNQYLSLDGGTTYQYLTGSSVINDVAVFSDTGGGLTDSGIAKSTLLTTSTAAGGDLTGTLPNPILATVNSNVGSIGDATHTLTLTLDDKGRTTAASTNLITPAGIGAPQTNGTGATGTWPISITGNAATVTTNANMTGDVTSVGNASTLASSGINKVVAITQVSGTSQAMTDTAPINRYFLINSSLATLTLPTSLTVGHVFEIVGAGNALWTIAQNVGQSLVTSANGIAISTTPGTSGHTDGANNTDCIDFMYVGSGEFVIKSMQTSGTGVVLN